MDEIPDVLDQLKAACVGHPHAKIAWPHRLLHSAIAEIEQLRAALLSEREAATKAERERWVQAALNASATETLVGNFVTEDDPAIQRGE